MLLSFSQGFLGYFQVVNLFSLFRCVLQSDADVASCGTQLHIYTNSSTEAVAQTQRQ
jgi:hypothetical protein